MLYMLVFAVWSADPVAVDSSTAAALQRYFEAIDAEHASSMRTLERDIRELEIDFKYETLRGRKGAIRAKIQSLEKRLEYVKANSPEMHVTRGLQAWTVETLQGKDRVAGTLPAGTVYVIADESTAMISVPGSKVVLTGIDTKGIKKGQRLDFGGIWLTRLKKEIKEEHQHYLNKNGATFAVSLVPAEIVKAEREKYDEVKKQKAAVPAPPGGVAPPGAGVEEKPGTRRP